MKPHLELLDKLGACAKAQVFAHTQPDLETAWRTCKRSDWMIWLLDKLGFKDDRAYRLYACRCVRDTPLADGRTVWDLLTDPRSRNAVEVAERFANGQASQEELDAAWDAAWAAAWDARDAWAAAWDARDAWAAAWDAWAAAWDARDAWAAAWDARDAAWAAAQADYLWELVPWATVKTLVDNYQKREQ